MIFPNNYFPHKSIDIKPEPQCDKLKKHSLDQLRQDKATKKVDDPHERLHLTGSKMMAVHEASIIAEFENGLTYSLLTLQTKTLYS